MKKRLAGALVGSAALLSGGAVLAYRRDVSAAYARLELVHRQVANTGFGAIEYVDQGSGLPLLMSHGIFHGCDGGLTSVQDMVVDRRVIVPSRFGYLGSAMPSSATPASQADAFVALLDHLDLPDVDVLAVSAGTSAAVQLALRHPSRVRHLVVSSGNFPGSGTATAPPEWAKLFYSDAAMWMMKTFARPAFAGLMGVPDGFPQDSAQAAAMAQLLESIFPINPRAEGAVFDAYVANPQINNYPLESIAVPTLVLHAKDDPLASFDAACAAVERIPRARLVALDSGGHLQLGQSDRVRREVSDFLAQDPEPVVSNGP